MPATTVSNTYTPAGGPTMGKYQQLAQQYSSAIKGAPALKQAVGETMMATEGAIEPMADERARMVEQLYKADKDLAVRYQSPESSMYIESPLAAQQAISGATAPMWGGIEKMNTMIGSRQKVLGDALSKGMEIHKAGLDAMGTELDNMYKMLALSQSGTKESTTEKKERIKDELGYDISTGEKDPNLLQNMMKKYRGVLAPNEIIEIYNVNSPFGPAKETVAELVSAYGFRPPTSVAKAQDQYSKAKMALAEIKRIDDESKKLNNYLKKVYGVPVVGAWIKELDPEVKAYENSVSTSAANLAKLLYGTSYMTGIRAVSDAIPKIGTTERERQSNVDQLYNQAYDRMGEATELAGSFALDRGADYGISNFATATPEAPAMAGSVTGMGEFEVIED